MTEKEIQVEVAVLKTDMSHIKDDIGEIKICLKDIKDILDVLGKNNHDPKECEKKHQEEIKLLKQNAVFKSDVKNAKNLLIFLGLFASLLGALVWGNNK